MNLKLAATASLLLITCSLLKSQSRVSGQVVDENEVVQPFANVVLLAAEDSAFIKGEVATLEGRFTFTNVNAGAYFCEVSMVGCSTLRTAIFNLDGVTEPLDLGSIEMAQNLSLKEVEIVARKAMIEVRSDKIVFNVGATPSISGSNGLELLGKAPGVQVNMDRNVSLLGKGGVQIYINGRP